MNISSKFPALADPTRRAILESLAQRHRSVADLASEFPISRPAVSQHLKVLQDAGLVRSAREGTRNIYEVDAAGITVLRDYLDDLWSLALRDLKSVAEATYAKTKSRSRK